MYENFNKTENIFENDIKKNFSELFFYLILDCIGVIGGFFGNILIIGSIIFTKEFILHDKYYHCKSSNS